MFNVDKLSSSILEEAQWACFGKQDLRKEMNLSVVKVPKQDEIKGLARIETAGQWP